MCILSQSAWKLLIGWLVLNVYAFSAAQTTSPDSTQPVGDPIAAAIKEAGVQHQQAVEAAEKKLLNSISQAINAAADAGDLATVKSLQTVKATAEENGSVSDEVKNTAVLVAKVDYDKSIDLARSNLKAAYVAAVRAYTRAREFAKAQSTQDALDSLVDSDPTMKPHVVDLLRIVDRKRDAFYGHWNLQDGELSDERSGGCQIRFPYKPPAEYDYHVVYDREGGDWGILMLFCDSGHMLGCDMPNGQDSAESTVFGFSDSVKFATAPSTATHCDFLARVRNDRLTIVINGEKLFDRQIHSSADFGQVPDYMSNPDHFGLGVLEWWGRTTITKAEITEISGTGEILNPGAGK